jgi:hypothetical protein
LAILIYLIFEKPLRVFFLLDSDEMKMMATMTWLKILKAEVTVVDFKPHISLYFRGKKIYSKIRKKKMKADKSSWRALSLHDSKIRTFYGLSQPHLTGIFFAAANFLSSLTETIEIEQFPEYAPLNEYLRIEAETSVNLGKTLFNLISLKINRKRRREKPWISHT